MTHRRQLCGTWSGMGWVSALSNDGGRSLLNGKSITSRNSRTDFVGSIRRLQHSSMCFIADKGDNDDKK